MSDIKVQTLKGFRDFLPVEARKRLYVINKLRSVFELFGFEPLETPALEYEEILLGKYGEEGDKLMYRFEDNGGRRVALRYDQTVPLARVVAQYGQQLPTPFKRYQIQPVWRAENTQKGRFREFLQSDIDIVGLKSAYADAEILSIIYKAYSALALDIQILINDRSQLTNIENKYLSSIDKVGKIPEQEIIKEMESKGMSVEQAEKTFNDVLNKPEPDSVKKIKSLFVEMGNPEEALQYRSVLIRGLDYYTGFIFEVIIKGATKLLSIGGGGRYDKLIGMFSGKDIPAVGFAFGFDRLMEAMEELKLFPEDLGGTKVLVTIFSQELEKNSIEISSQLHLNNINTEVWLDPNTKLEKQLKYADQKGIPYVIIIGPEEVESGKVVLKSLKGRTQEMLSLDEIISKLI